MARVIVVGAGIAGLCAAYELQLRGFEVTVLEARDRIGGRVHTIYEPFQYGQFAEAGATVVPDSHHLTKHYLAQFDIPLVLVPSNSSAVYQIRGQRSIVKNEDADSPSVLQKKYLKPFMDQVAAALPADLQPPVQFKTLDEVTLYQFLLDQGISDENIARLRMEYIDEWGDGIGSYSALSGFYDLARGRANSLFRIGGGSDRLPAAFSARLNDVFMNCPVRRITQAVDHVEIAFSQNGNLQTRRCDFVVCTIPFSILSHVQMNLTTEKQNLIAQVGYTSVCRVYAQVRERFWVEESLSGYGYTDREFMSVFHSTANQPGPAGILEAYLSGKLAREISSMSEKEGIHTTLQWIEELHPQLRRYVIEIASVCWDNDPWAGGAYAWFKPGQMTNLLPVLGAPEGRIHFAGDHTSALPGWMQGALESAHRVVTEISRRPNGGRASVPA